ncbi:Pepco domain-containing protein [Egbenema bharatensis]|uniref:Pepco domain-containing protein n=1 Tax=Egbenema bharatensis TaxID=3463334 RepID=UPI003A88C4B3
MTDEAAQLWLMTEVETTETTEVVRGERNGSDTGGGFGPPRVTEQVKTIVRQRVPLDAVTLKTQMKGLLQVVSDVFDQANQQSDLQLDEVELSVEINAQGQVSIMGNGGSLSNRGAIKLKFKRTNP